MKRYFDDIKTLKGALNRRNKLALQHHPDKGGSDAVMKEINVQYEQCVKRLENAATRKRYARPEYTPPPRTYNDEKPMNEKRATDTETVYDFSEEAIEQPTVRTRIRDFVSSIPADDKAEIIRTGKEFGASLFRGALNAMRNKYQR